MLNGIMSFFQAQHSWLVECIGLFLTPFFHEDIAIIGGSLMIVEHRLPTPFALVSLYAGMVSSDLALYGLGAVIKRQNRLRRILLRPRLERMGQWLGKHVATTIVIARLVPGLMFPVYLGCGLYGISFTRFTLATSLTAAVYLPIMLYLISTFGESVLAKLGPWSWSIMIGIAVVAIANWMRRPNWQILLRICTSGVRALFTRARVTTASPGQASHRGMPSLGTLSKTVAFAEKIPPILFYLPLGIQWFWLGLRHHSLSLPTLANPMIAVGGLWGESKSACLDMVGGEQRRWLADYATIRRGRGDKAAGADPQRAIQIAHEAGLSFPLVAKPDIGWRGFGVRLINSPADLSTYVLAYPEDETILLQKVIDCDGEAGVLYARMPGADSGVVISLTFRYFPYVIGDGRHSIRDLILGDQRARWKAGEHFGFDLKHVGTAAHESGRVPAAGETVRLSFIGSNRVGGLYRDGRDHITPELTRRFDFISRSMPEFYYGRYDIRFASVDALRQGEDFKIIEINGAGGESINVWDPTMPVRQVYRELFAQQRLLFEIGAKNRARGFRPSGVLSILGQQWHQFRLIQRYPPSS